MIQLTDVNTDPTGNPTKLITRITCVDGEGSVIKTNPVIIETEDDGAYDFNLMKGSFSVEILNDSQWNLLANVLVDDSTPTEENL